MKKFASIVASATLLGGGLVAATAPTAAAACGDYPSCIDTATKASALNNPRVGRPARVATRVVANARREPQGTLTYSYQRESNGDVVGVFSRHYDGGRETYAFWGLPRGEYTVKVLFQGDRRFENSRDSFSQRVRPRR